MPDELENHRKKNYAGAKNSFRFVTNEWLEFKKDIGWIFCEKTAIINAIILKGLKRLI